MLATMGLRLSAEKTLITHIDEGLDFLGWRIQRHRKRGTASSYVYIYPAKKAVLAVNGRSRRCAEQEPTSRSMTCCADSTRCCRAGRPTSGPGCPGDLRLPEPLHLADGVAMAAPQTPPITWKELAALLRRRLVASHRGTCADRSGETAPPATATAERSSPRPGQPPMRTPRQPDRACGEPGALKGARRVREAARENGTATTTVTASRADFHQPATALITGFIADHQGRRDGPDGLRWGVEPICTQLYRAGCADRPVDLLRPGQS